MEELIEIHRQAKQKHEQARAELNNLQINEKELKGRISRLASNVINAEQTISKALTSKSLEKARADVEAARRMEDDAKTLLSNTERAIRELKESLPSLHNDIALAEQDIWAEQYKRLIQEIKAHPDILQLFMKAYAALWQTDYRWEFEIFIREKILDAEFRVDPDILANLKAEMAQQIWPQSDIQISN